MKIGSCIIVLLIYFVVSSSTANNKTKVSLYFEALCIDCVNFITKQLYPTYKILHKYMELDFIPFGKANYYLNHKGEWSFNCMHGDKECRHNAIMGCVLHQKLSDNANLDFIHCFLVTRDVHRCTKLSGADYKRTADCINNPRESSKYLAALGSRTHKEFKDIPVVPLVAINNIRFGSAERNLYGVICMLHQIPLECAMYDSLRLNIDQNSKKKIKYRRFS